MQTGYFIAIATAALWSAVLAAPTGAPKSPGPEEAHKRMPKIVAAYEDLRGKFEKLKEIMTEIKSIGYEAEGAQAAAQVVAEKKINAFEALIHVPGEKTSEEAKPPASTGTSIDDAPVEHHMTPSERMKMLSKKFHASHDGPGSFVHPVVGSSSSSSPSSSSSSSSPAAASSPVDSLAAALSHLKDSLKETMVETPVSNPNTKDKIDIAEKMRAKLKVQDRLQKFREKMSRNRVHRVGEIIPPVILNRSGYRRLRRDTTSRKKRTIRKRSAITPCRHPFNCHRLYKH